jgi:hypothetical protein
MVVWRAFGFDLGSQGVPFELFFVGDVSPCLEGSLVDGYLDKLVRCAREYGVGFRSIIALSVTMVKRDVPY